MVEDLTFQVAVKSSYESKARSLVRSELPFFLPEIRYSRVGVSSLSQAKFFQIIGYPGEDLIR